MIPAEGSEVKIEVDRGAVGSPGAHGSLRAALDALRTTGIHQITRLDPVLLAALRVPDGASLPEARELARRSLLTHADRLSPELRTAFLEAAGFRRDAPARAGERIQALADHLHISRRSAYRRVQKAIDQLTVMLLAGSERCVVEDIDYVFLNSRVRVDLEGDSPTVVTERTISARSDNVSHLDDRLYFPRLTGDFLNLRALEGCTVTSNELVSPGVWAVRVELPRTFRAGERHTFALSVRLPDHDSFEPVIGFLPYTTSFDATVELRFGNRRPASLEQFVALPPIPGAPRPSDTQRVTPVERKHVFVLPQMRPGWCYGIKWSWDTPAQPPSVPVL